MPGAIARLRTSRRKSGSRRFDKLGSFRGEAPFEHWLMRMTVRTCYDFLRGHQRNRESAFPN